MPIVRPAALHAPALAHSKVKYEELLARRMPPRSSKATGGSPLYGAHGGGSFSNIGAQSKQEAPLVFHHLFVAFGAYLLHQFWGQRQRSARVNADVQAVSLDNWRVLSTTASPPDSTATELALASEDQFPQYDAIRAEEVVESVQALLAQLSEDLDALEVCWRLGGTHTSLAHVHAHTYLRVSKHWNVQDGKGGGTKLGQLGHLVHVHIRSAKATAVMWTSLTLSLVKNRGRPSRDFVFPRRRPENGQVFSVRTALVGGTRGQNRSVFIYIPVAC